MSKRRPHTRALCRVTGKVKFRDRVEADLRLEHIQLRARRTIHDEKRSYRCNHCGSWHLTSEDLKTPLPYSA